MKRLGSVLALAAVLLAATVTFDVPPAGACSCMASTDADAFRRSDAVFVGTVAGYTAKEPMTTSTDPAVWSFSVSDVYKGKVLGHQQVVSEVSGASCGLEMPHRGEYLVFATVEGSGNGFDPSPGQLYAGLCGGTRSTVEGPLDPALARARAPIPTGSDDVVRGTDMDFPAAPVVAIVLVVGLGVALLVYQHRKDAATRP